MPNTFMTWSRGRSSRPSKPLRLVVIAPIAAPTDPALWHSLRAAAADKRLGETVLLVLVALGQRDLAQASPLTLSAVIVALRQVGLDAEARALAVEAAIAAGV